LFIIAGDLCADIIQIRQLDAYTTIYVTGSMSASHLYIGGDAQLVVVGDLKVTGLTATSLGQAGSLIVKGEFETGSWWDTSSSELRVAAPRFNTLFTDYGSTPATKCCSCLAAPGCRSRNAGEPETLSCAMQPAGRLRGQRILPSTWDPAPERSIPSLPNQLNSKDADYADPWSPIDTTAP
jgi:hypothetical protein